jgi:hypothetical protein
MLGTGRYPTAETVTRTVDLADAPSAMMDWDSDPSAVTKIHVRIESNPQPLEKMAS